MKRIEFEDWKSEGWCGWIEVDLVKPSVPARLHGAPEECDPGEPAEFSLVDWEVCNLDGNEAGSDQAKAVAYAVFESVVDELDENDFPAERDGDAERDAKLDMESK